MSAFLQQEPTFNAVAVRRSCHKSVLHLLISLAIHGNIRHVGGGRLVIELDNRNVWKHRIAAGRVQQLLVENMRTAVVQGIRCSQYFCLHKNLVSGAKFI